MKNREVTKEELQMGLKKLFDIVFLLSLDYTAQISALSLANDDIPSDIACDVEWALGLAKELHKQGILSEDILLQMENINRRFDEVSRGQKHYEEIIWTDEGLKTHPFWEKQRELASQILRELKKVMG